MQVTLFWPEPQTAFTNDLLIDEQKSGSLNHWHEIGKAINEALIEARHNPETARCLFALASYRRRELAVLPKLWTTFSEDGIPPEFLSHYEPEAPFAFLRLNDGLCDKF